MKIKGCIPLRGDNRANGKLMAGYFIVPYNDYVWSLRILDAVYYLACRLLHALTSKYIYQIINWHAYSTPEKWQLVD